MRSILGESMWAATILRPSLTGLLPTTTRAMVLSLKVTMSLSPGSAPVADAASLKPASLAAAENLSTASLSVLTSVKKSRSSLPIASICPSPSSPTLSQPLSFFSISSSSPMKPLSHHRP